jgi:hypothetical protein
MVVGHVRSASVPCHSHPVVMQVEDQLVALRSWTSDPGQNPLSLAHVRALLCVLDELLHLPLGLGSATDTLLDGFLLLADASGSFLAALLALRQYAADLRAAVRRRDPAKVASAARKQRQLGKELEQLAAAMAREAARCSSRGTSLSSATEVARTVAEAINDIAVASAFVFVEVGALAHAAAAAGSPAATSSTSKSKKQTRLRSASSSSRSKQRRKASEEQREALALSKLQELEQCIGELESETEKLFRSLVQTRVSLLNIHTQGFY